MACTINVLPHWDHASTVKCKRKQWKALKWFTLWPFINQEEKNSRRAKFVRFIWSFWLSNRDYVCLSCKDIYGAGRSLTWAEKKSQLKVFFHPLTDATLLCIFLQNLPSRVITLYAGVTGESRHWLAEKATCLGPKGSFCTSGAILPVTGLLLLALVTCKTHKSPENKIATHARRDISISQSPPNVNSYKSKADLTKCPYQCLKTIRFL